MSASLDARLQSASCNVDQFQPGSVLAITLITTLGNDASTLTSAQLVSAISSGSTILQAQTADMSSDSLFFYHLDPILAPIIVQNFTLRYRGPGSSPPEGTDAKRDFFAQHNSLSYAVILFWLLVRLHHKFLPINLFFEMDRHATIDHLGIVRSPVLICASNLILQMLSILAPPPPLISGLSGSQNCSTMAANFCSPFSYCLDRSPGFQCICNAFYEDVPQNATILSSGSDCQCRRFDRNSTFSLTP
ncbi:unnamed protein product [Protopolystoma xenopodis]|uniref:Uncharacterized protein n=1 Tax=Protopolystoma xenopodis TaxID=117903 RepID=A0A3S5CCS4_9PLAT|nr:unnamed protein product [Protopolystoma xenopodis]